MNETAKVYFGSAAVTPLGFIAAGKCVAGSPDIPKEIALGKWPSSTGYGKGPGWIYELDVLPSQLAKKGVDTILTEDVIPVRRFRPSEHSRPSAKELLDPQR